MSSYIFPANLPSKTWVHRFMKRHTNIVARAPENLGHLRKDVTEKSIRDWFGKLEHFLLSEYNIIASEFITPENANRIFNLDESGFPLGGKNRMKVIAEKGKKNIYSVTTESKEQVTVLMCASGDGNFQKPYVIFPGVKPVFHFKDVDPSKYDVGPTPNGWMTSEAFFEWFIRLFVPNLKERGVEFPILVFMDGHSSHLSYSAVKCAQENNVILFCFPPHTSHILQPLDVSVFGPLKQFWNKSLINFKGKYNVTMTRANFFPVFDEAFQKAKGRPDNVKSGFRKCGIIPFTPDAIDYSRLIDPRKAREKYTVVDKCSSEQRLGFIRSFQLLKGELSCDNLKLFEKRYEEGYDVPGVTNVDQLWRCYKVIRDLIQSSLTEPSSVNLPSSAKSGPSYPVSFALNMPSSSVPNLLNPTTSGSSLMTEHSVSCSNGVSPTNYQFLIEGLDCNHNVESFQPTSFKSRPITGVCDSGSSPVAGPSASVLTALDKSRHTPDQPSLNEESIEYCQNYDKSPFKSYLKIHDQIILTKRVVKSKPYMPHAVSGTDYVNFLLKKQIDKRNEEENKKKRKMDRENKRSKKMKRMRVNKQPFHSSYDSDDSDVDESYNSLVFNDNAENEDININSEECCACGGSNQAKNGDAWMGCNYCYRWFHRACLDESY